jgi:hypothetical protein
VTLRLRLALSAGTGLFFTICVAAMAAILNSRAHGGAAGLIAHLLDPGFAPLYWLKIDDAASAIPGLFLNFLFYSFLTFGVLKFIGRRASPFFDISAD